jgi:hypothetical protein
MLSADDERYNVKRLLAGASMPPVGITEISNTRKCLDMKHLGGNNVQRLGSVIGDKKKMLLRST